jgi:hypothetical protein
MKSTRFAAVPPLAASLVLLCAAPAFGAAAGEKWEYTVTVDMDGMKMPMQPVKVCEGAAQGDMPPLESNCELKSRSISDGTTRFHVVCGPPQAGEVTGQFTRDGDRVEGNYTFSGSGAQMKMTTVGHRLGNCDPAKARRSAHGR